MLLWSAFAHAAPCASVIPVQDFRDEVDAVWGRASADGFAAVREAVLHTQAQIRCLDGPLTPRDAAAFHRNRALASLASEDPDAARAAVQAAVRLAPDEATVWLEASDELAALIDLQAQPARVVEELQTSLAARVYTDGTLGAIRHVGEPVIVQGFAPDGTPLDGAWIAPRAPTPTWVTFPPPICEGPIPADQIVQHARDAQRAFEDLQVDAFVAALEAVAAELPCADRVLAPEAAAVIHQLEGVRLFIRGSSVASVRAFQQAQALDPAFEPTARSMPDGGSLRRYWHRAADAATPPWLPMDVPDALGVWVDGLETRQRPATLPSIVQLTSANGEVLWTRFVPATVPLPELGALVPVDAADPLDALPPALAVYRRAEQRERRLARRLPLRAVGFGSLIASAGLLIANSSFSASFNDPALHPDRLQSRQRAVNLTFGVGLALGVGGVAAVGAAEVF